MTSAFTGPVVEQADPVWLEALGYAVLHEPDIAAGMLGAERSEPIYRDMVLEGRLCQTLVRLNPDLSPVDLRDTLLPEFISGELRVKDVERIVEVV
jgi:type I restriction enzyme, R subunit